MTASNPSASLRVNLDAERLIALLREAGRAVAPGSFDAADWQRIVELAQRQSVAPILYARLKERDSVPSPGSAQRLREIYLGTFKRNARLLHEVGKILRALQASDIPVIPLKGAYLVEAVYGNLGLRQIGDVDLLVKPVDLAKALEVLRTLGYAAAHPIEIESVRQVSQHMPPLSKQGGVTLELHWTILNPCKNAHFGDRDLDQVWSRAIPARIGGVQALSLPPTDLLWYLCVHASLEHRFNGVGLRAFWDLALVIRRFTGEIDWELFARCVNQWRMANGVSLALQLAEEWTGAVIPKSKSVTRSLVFAPLDEATVDWIRQKIWNGVSPEVQTDVARLGRPRLTDRLAGLRATLFPPRAMLAVQYHIPANSRRILCYYPVRFKDLWRRHSQTLWQLLRGDQELVAQTRQEARLYDYLNTH